MKNKVEIFFGIAVAAFSIFIVSGFLQYLVGIAFGVDAEIAVSSLGITPVLVDISSTGAVRGSVILLGRIFAIVLITEIAFLILRTITLLKIRKTAIVIILIQTGFFIIYIFYEIFLSFIDLNSESLFNLIVKLWNLELTQKYVIIIFAVLLTFSYLQIIQKRILKYISNNEE